MNQPDTGPRATFEQWRVLGMLVICVLVNYLDRNNLGVAAVAMKKDIVLTEEQRGLLFSAFFATYALGQLAAGWLVERFDVYRVLAAGFFLMSVATALTSMVHTFGELLVLRLTVGAGAVTAFPAFSKIVASNFRETQRGKANALIDLGTKIATPLGMMIGGYVLLRWNWQTLFAALGLGALVWLPLWFRWRPPLHAEAARAAAMARPPGTLELLGQRSLWGTFVGLYCLNSAWYFLITWFPYYLMTERRFSTERMAVLGSLPFWLLAGSTTLSGWVADHWIGRGGNPTVVRKTFLVTGMLACTLLLPAAAAHDDRVSIALFTVACFTFGMTTSNHWGVTQTLAGPAAAGKWTGMQNAFGNLSGVVMPWITGVIVGKTGSFLWAFVLVAVMVTVGAASYAFVVGRVEQVKWR